MMERLPERKSQIGNPKTSIWISCSDFAAYAKLNITDQSKHFTIYSNIQNVENDSVDISVIESH